MRRKVHVLITLLLTIGLSGCSNVIYKQFSIDNEPAGSLSLDARQRVILVTDKGGKSGDRRVVCAEPSPDVMAAIAAAVSGELGRGETKAGFSTAMAQSVGRIGPRTQTIQLLRDGLYRACEAFMNGIIDEEHYRTMILAYDETMITLLGIDGLTRGGAMPAPHLVSEAKADDQQQNPEADAGNPDSSSDGQQAEASENMVISREVAAAVRDILKDYYRFQLDIKEIDIEKTRLK